MPIRIIVITISCFTLLDHFLSYLPSVLHFFFFLGINSKTKLLLQLSKIQYIPAMMDNCSQLGPVWLQVGFTFD